MRWDGSKQDVYGSSRCRRRFERQRPDTPEVPRHRSSKDTRKWCRGKTGIEHRVEVSYDRPWGVVHFCSVCGKHIEFGKQQPYWLLPRGM